ncbi:testis-expressed protein 47 isoform X1 [Triplophysa rosa]|uniref:testis-expressed protein 47 isoform X1 n=1 Tax=Triplophysa rosa TaxID=992332 RepID=UPI002545C8C9|nr:testis-expressed protein 47 isoform X1 [Triplophysa rosa]
MASRFSSSSLEDRVSLFARLMDNHRSVRKKFLLHRLVVVSGLPPGLADRQTVGDHYEKFIYSQKRSRAGEDVTGLLLLYPQHALHVIECSTEVLLSVIQDLTHMQKTPDSAVMLTPRVLLVSHDISSRLFQQWSFTLLKDGRLTVNSDEQSCETLVIQTLHQLLRLASHLHTAGENIKECKEIPEEVLQKSQLIPPQTAVCRLVQMEALLSPVQYLDTYHSPLHQLLDSESVWPAAEHSSHSLNDQTQNDG